MTSLAPSIIDSGRGLRNDLQVQICKFPECGRPVMARQLCQTHYQQQRRGEELRPVKEQKRVLAGPCKGPECGHYARYGGLCWAHRQQILKSQELRPLREPGRKPCSFEGCGRDARRQGLCDSHNGQRRRGVELRPIHVPAYRYVVGGGYVRLKLPDHPNACKNGSVFEHVVVMANKIGRPLLPGENVHHINGVRDDNRPENLELWVTSHPKGQRVEDKVEWAVEMLRRYAPERLAWAHDFLGA